MKQEQHDFAQRYFNTAAKLIQEHFRLFPDKEINGTWGPWGRWRFSKDLNGWYRFWCQDCGPVGGYWETKANESHVILFQDFTADVCENIKSLTEYDMWHRYIGDKKPGWSLRWYEAIKHACKQVNILNEEASFVGISTEGQEVIHEEEMDD